MIFDARLWDDFKLLDGVYVHHLLTGRGICASMNKVRFKVFKCFLLSISVFLGDTQRNQMLFIAL